MGGAETRLGEAVVRRDVAPGQGVEPPPGSEEQAPFVEPPEVYGRDPLPGDIPRAEDPDPPGHFKDLFAFRLSGHG